MILLDVNILVYAHRRDSENHDEYRKWLEEALQAEAPCGVSELVLAAMIRIVTNPRIFPDSTPINTALEFADQLREHPGCAIVSPGELHWSIFTRLCRGVGAKGNLVSDAYFAALAIESGAEWITTDRDYSRFPCLRWRHPLD